jgi:hypothetical protein
MTIGQFEKFMQEYELALSRSTEASKIGIDLITYDEVFYRVIDTLGKGLFTIEGWDWVSWYAIETDFQKKKYEAHDADKTLICQDLEGLYDYLIKEKYISSPQED